MAVVNLNDGNTLWSTASIDNIPLVAFRLIGTAAAGFIVLALNIAGVTYYYWPNSSGALRYGTTEPTTATQDTEGGAV